MRSWNWRILDIFLLDTTEFSVPAHSSLENILKQRQKAFYYMSKAKYSCLYIFSKLSELLKQGTYYKITPSPKQSQVLII